MLGACERAAFAAGLEGVRWAILRQTHSTEVRKAEGLGEGRGVCLGEADALWTEEAGVGLAVQTADCIPILLLDRRRRRIAAVHAGWRGTWGRIIWEQLALWYKEGSRPSDIEAALGPSIGPCCYEVDEALAQQFAGRWGGGVLKQPEGASKPRLNLVEALELDLMEVGVLPLHIQRAELCTYCDTRFHSYRREKGRAGRQLSWVVCRF